MSDNDYGATGTSKGPGAASGIEPGDGSLRAPTLTDDRLAELADKDTAWHREGTQRETISIAAELQQHRAMVKRLEEWCLGLPGDSRIMGGHVWVGDMEVDGKVALSFARQLRNLMKGDVK